MKPLTKENVATYIDRNVPIKRVLFSKEFRAPFFGVLRKILENPLEELITTNLYPVQPIVEKEGGLVLLYDGRCPKYLEDKINWRKGKMSVKQILFDEKDSSFRLKNHKSDKGKPVMRRQTWIQNSSGQVLRRHEYRLFSRATFLKPESDGSLSRNEGASLQAFPVIVHYFQKAGKVASESRTLRARKKRERLDEEDVEIEEEEDEDEYEEEEVMMSEKVVPEVKKQRSMGGFVPQTPTEVPVMPVPGEELVDDWFGTKRLKLERSWVDEANDSGVLAFDDRSMFRESFGLSQSFGDGMAAAIMVTPDTTCNIDSCVPDYAHQPVKVLAVVSGFAGPNKDSYDYVASFSDTDVPAEMVSDGVVSFTCPAHQPGVVNFWISRKSKVTKQVEYTKHLPFLFLPAPQGDGRLSLAWNHLKTFPIEWADRFNGYTKELDVSFNSLENLDFIKGFNLLHTLVADNNLITGTSFPYLPKVLHLSLNRNSIMDLDRLVDALAASFPNLQFLSLLGNDVCPIFSGDAELYEVYKRKITSRLPSLKILDSTNVEKKK